MVHYGYKRHIGWTLQRITHGRHGALTNGNGEDRVTGNRTDRIDVERCGVQWAEVPHIQLGNY
jgi:hypothetical protein